jgi:lipopolysaccharide/colanic/teichoic acid biosynthesis glycosyltransferase
MGAEHGVLFKAKNDPRITEFGKFIRKTSLDEFPQFFNVLKGDMSMVGPRPQQQYEVDQYESLYSTRLLVKPGITGPWQISGRSNLSQREAEQLDVSYIQDWSLTGDLAILFKTVGAVVKGTGSY